MFGGCGREGGRAGPTLSVIAVLMGPGAGRVPVRRSLSRSVSGTMSPVGPMLALPDMPSLVRLSETLSKTLSARALDSTRPSDRREETVAAR